MKRLFSPGKQLIQVCFNLNDIDTRERETRSLIKAAKKHNIKELTIITYDEEETIKVEDMSISVMPVWKWVLM